MIVGGGGLRFLLFRVYIFGMIPRLPGYGMGRKIPQVAKMAFERERDGVVTILRLWLVFCLRGRNKTSIISFISFAT